MSQIGFGTITCSLVGWLCAAAPDATIIQAAYEREAAAGSSLHDIGLRVLNAKCHGGEGGGYLCEVTFTASSDPNGRLYFDIVALAQANDRWTLTSGLCRR
jgi:hypothetical protein